MNAPVSFGARRLGPVLASFTSKYPKVKIDLQLTDAELDLVAAGIDLAVRVSRDLPESLVARRIGDADLGLFGSPRYLAENASPEHPSELERHECLTHSGAAMIGQWTFRHRSTGKRLDHMPAGGLSSNNGDALLAAAEHGMGLVLLPTYLAEGAVARG